MINSVASPQDVRAWLKALQLPSIDKTCEVNASKALKTHREAENVISLIQNGLKSSLPGREKDQK